VRVPGGDYQEPGGMKWLKDVDGVATPGLAGHRGARTTELELGLLAPKSRPVAAAGLRANSRATPQCGKLNQNAKTLAQLQS